MFVRRRTEIAESDDYEALKLEYIQFLMTTIFDRSCIGRAAVEDFRLKMHFFCWNTPVLRVGFRKERVVLSDGRAVIYSGSCIFKN